MHLAARGLAVLLLGALGGAAGCSTRARPPIALASSDHPGVAPASAPEEPPPPVPTPTPPAVEAQPPAPEPSLPDGLEPGLFTAFPIPADADVDVAHGSARAPRAIVYLHGACGDPRAPRAWAAAAVDVGTVISLHGDRSCGKSGRRYWGPDAAALEARIQSALAEVAKVRGALFDPETVVLMGYSQGATLAQAVHQLHPDRYPLVLLAGIPVEPSARHLARARAVAVLGGERELTTHMRSGVLMLQTRGVPVRFDTFPKAAHGDFGPDAERVMRDTFAWLLTEP